MPTINRVVQILMDRDGMSQTEAEELVDDTRSELLDAMEGTSCVDADEILMDNLGLEPDYIFDII